MVNIWKYKALFMVRGFVFDYEETTAPMGRYTSWYQLQSQNGGYTRQTRRQFLYDVVKNEVYMEQSLGFETHGRQSHVYKALYGLKQVLRTWYGRFDGFLIGLDFTKGKVDYNLCDKIDDGDDPIHRMLMDMGDS